MNVRKTKEGNMRKRLKLKKLRAGYDLSMDKMAEKCGVCLSTYNSIENGRTVGSLEFWNAVKRNFNLSSSEMWEMMIESKE